MENYHRTNLSLSSLGFLRLCVCVCVYVCVCVLLSHSLLFWLYYFAPPACLSLLVCLRQIDCSRVWLYPLHAYMNGWFNRVQTDSIIPELYGVWGKYTRGDEEVAFSPLQPACLCMFFHVSPHSLLPSAPSPHPSPLPLTLLLFPSPSSSSPHPLPLVASHFLITYTHTLTRSLSLFPHTPFVLLLPPPYFSSCLPDPSTPRSSQYSLIILLPDLPWFLVLECFCGFFFQLYVCLCKNCHGKFIMYWFELNESVTYVIFCLLLKF